MHRFFLPPERTLREILTLSPEDSHHAVRVLRLGPGDPVTVLDGAGNEILGVVGGTARDAVTVQVQQRVAHPPPPVHLVLVQAISKTQAMDGIIHRAVELGCGAVQPLLAERSVSRPDNPAAKCEKWREMVREAAKQCGNPWPTQVLPILTPGDWLAGRPREALALIGSLADPPVSLRAALQTWWFQSTPVSRQVAVIVGPEGDFTEAEYAAFRAHSARPISLGRWTLRVETAAIAALAMVAHELAELPKVVSDPSRKSNGEIGSSTDHS